MVAMGDVAQLIVAKVMLAAGLLLGWCSHREVVAMVFFSDERRQNVKVSTCDSRRRFVTSSPAMIGRRSGGRIYFLEVLGVDERWWYHLEGLGGGCVVLMCVCGATSN